QEAANTLGVPLFGQIPLVPALRVGGDDGTPIVVSDPDSPAGAALRQAAQRLARETRTLIRKPLSLGVAPKPGAANANGSPNGHETNGSNGHAGHVHEAAPEAGHSSHAGNAHEGHDHSGHGH
ncbi:MAG TPA: hypothetical protein DIU14_02020, partial [Actinobacteria bacterium]|nr:hypothetical protein [Actinomycetota bacterium]